MAESNAIILKNATIISYDEETKSLKTILEGSVLIENGRISKVTEGHLDSIPLGADIVNAAGKIISPGFVDTHHHMWQSAFRTLAADTTLSEYFAGRHSQLGPAGKHFTPKDVWLGQMACALELIDGGTTTVLDHAHAVFTNDHVDAAVNASFQSGLRLFYAHTIQSIETTGYTIDDGLAKLASLARDDRFRDTQNIVALAVAHDGWAFASDQANKTMFDFFQALNDTATGDPTMASPLALLTTHYVSGPFPAHNTPRLLKAVQEPADKTSKLMPIVFSHASFIDQQNVQIIRDTSNFSISTTPESEAHYGHTTTGALMAPDVASLGVDSHFTFSSYLPIQARLYLQAQRHERYTQTLRDNWEVPIDNPMKVADAFLLMTQKGGEALGRSDIGVIKEGAVADLVVIDKMRPAMWAAKDPVAAVVLHSSVADVEGVIVNGKWLKRDGKLSALPGANGEKVEVEVVRKMFEESANAIQEIWAREVGPVNFEEGTKSISGARYGNCRCVDVRRND